jgi:hypothetical protein
MAEYVENPRRSPRAPIRCEARVALREGGFWAGPTSDYGPRGCQLVAPAHHEPGSRIFLELANARVAGQHHLSGRIAWCATVPPWRIGVAFDEGSAEVARRFFDRLAAAYPGLDTCGRAPDRLPVDANLAPAPVPGVEPALVPGERRILRAIGAGVTAGALRDGLGPEWAASVHLLFALIGRRYVVVGPPDRESAAAWGRHLAKPER